MVEQVKRIQAAFFRSETGAEPVRDWLKALDKEDRFRIGADIKRLNSAGPSECQPASQ